MKKTELPKVTLLLIGVVLLAFTFVNAYVFLKEDVNIISTTGLVNLFGEALAPMIEACIRVLYLGIMGWIGSIVTIRGLQLLSSYELKTVSEIVSDVKPQVERTNSPKQSRSEQ